MDQGTIIDLARNALTVVIKVSAPILGLSLIIGLAVSIFQATTQIQEQTLTFIPKILAVVVSILLFGAWMLRILVEYTYNLYSHVNDFIR